MTMETSQLSIQVKSQGIVEATAALKALSQVAASIDRETKAFIMSQNSASVAQSKAAIAAAKVQTEIANQERVTAKLAETQARTSEVTQRALQRQIDAATKATQQAELHSEAMKKQQLIQEKLQNSIDSKSRSLDISAKSIENVNRHGGVFNNTLRSMTTAALAYMGVNFFAGIIKDADAWGMMQSKLSLAVGSMEVAKNVQNDLYNMSQKLRVPLEDSVKLFTRMAPPLQKMGLGVKDTKQVVESFSTALKLAGATGQEASSAMLQFSQSINAGRLNGGEFNSIAEAAPNVLRAVERELVRTGTSAEDASKKLKKMAADGKITTEVLVNALKNAAPQWQKDFESLPLTVDGALQRIKNAWLKTIGDLGQDTKFNEKMAQSLKTLEDILPTIANVIVGAFTLVVDHGGKVLTLLSSILAVMALYKTAAIVQTFLTAGAAAGGLAAGLTAVKAALLSIGITPVGLALTALAGVVALTAANWDKLTSSVSKTDEVNKSIMISSGEIVKGIQSENIALEVQIDKLRIANEKQEKYNSTKLEGFKVDSQNGLNELNRGLKVLENNLKAAEAAAKSAQNTSIFDPSKVTKSQSAAESVKEVQKAIDMQKRLIAIATVETTRNQRLDSERASEQREKDTRDRVKSIMAASKTERQILDDEFAKKKAAAEKEAKELGYGKQVANQNLLNIQSEYNKAVEKLEKKEHKPKKQVLFDAQVDAWNKWNDEKTKQYAEDDKHYEKSLKAAEEELAKNEALLNSNEKRVEVLAELAAQQAFVTLATLQRGEADEKEIKRAEKLYELARKNAEVVGQRVDKEEAAKSAEKADKALDEFLDPSRVDKFSEAIKGLGGAFTPLIKSIETYASKMSKLEKAKTDLANGTKKDAAFTKAFDDLQRKEVEYKLASYGDMASAAKGFFKEGTEGYKTMATVEQIFRATELANTLYNSEVGQGVISAITSLFVTSKATQGAADTAATGNSVANSMARATADGVAGVAKAIASMPFPLNLAAGAATIAALMAIGVKISGGKGNGSVDMTKQRQESAGTGSVLGNSSAKSESISKSLDFLGKISQNQLSRTVSMDNSLKLIANNITGLATVVVKASGGDLAAKGIKEGTSVNTGAAALSGIGIVGLIMSKMPMAGIVTQIMKKLFGDTTKILDTGIKGSAQSFADIQSRGLSASSYADVNTTKKFLGITYSDKTKQQTAALPKDVTDQFTMVVKSLADGVTTAAGLIGISGSAFTDKLNSFVVDIGNISTKGMTGEQIQKQFETIFSKIGDDMAKWTVGSLTDFAKIGEGAFETLVRVAGNLSVVNESFTALGFKTLTLSTEGIRASEAIVKLAGSVESFQEVTSSYYENFYTEEERNRNTLAQLTDAFKALGVDVLPTTRESLRALIEAANEAGDDAKAFKLMKLSNAFASVIKETERAEAVITSASDKRNLEIRIMELTGDAAGALAAKRQIELSGLDASAQSLQNRIYALEDEQSAAELAKSALEERNAKEKAALDEYLARVKAQEEAAAQLLAKRGDLEIEILRLTGNTVEATQRVRQKELASMDESLRPLQSRIYALQDEKLASDEATKALQEAAAAARSIATERAGLEKQLLQMQGNTAALRALEKGALHQSNQALQQSIYDLQDKQAADALKAQEQQQRAQQEQQMAQAMADAYQRQQEAAQRAKEAYKSLSMTLIDEANKIMGLVNGNTQQSLGAAQSAFSLAVVQAKSGDQKAAESLPELARTLLAIGENTLQTSQEFKFLQGATAGSLRTAGMYYEGLSNLPSFDVGTDSVPRDMIAQIHKGERIVPAAYNNSNDTDSLKQEIASLKGILENIAVSAGSIDRSSKDTNRMTKQVTQDGERMLTTNL